MESLIWEISHNFGQVCSFYWLVWSSGPHLPSSSNCLEQKLSCFPCLNANTRIARGLIIYACRYLKLADVYLERNLAVCCRNCKRRNNWGWNPEQCSTDGSVGAGGAVKLNLQRGKAETTRIWVGSEERGMLKSWVWLMNMQISIGRQGGSVCCRQGWSRDRAVKMQQLNFTPLLELMAQHLNFFKN